jgi:hypothetical protein
LPISPGAADKMAARVRVLATDAVK